MTDQPLSAPQPTEPTSISARLLVAFRSTEPAGSRTPSRVDDGLRAVLLALARAYAHLLRRFSTGRVFLPTEQVAWVNRLEANWQVIRAELDVLRQGFDLPALIEVIPGEQAVADARWKMFILRYYGRRIAENCSLCPRTAALLEGIPGLISANFSVLQPGARLAPHRGIFAGVLRYHLGLIVPEDAEHCGLRVDNEVRQWREGSSLLFDDTRQHEAWNDTNQDRVVLLVDVKRQLPAPLRWLNDAVLLLMSRVVMPPLARVDRMIPSAAPRPAAAGAETASRPQ
jgi:beta-hydroxylase